MRFLYFTHVTVFRALLCLAVLLLSACGGSSGSGEGSGGSGGPTPPPTEPPPSTTIEFTEQSAAAISVYAAAILEALYQLAGTSALMVSELERQPQSGSFPFCVNEQGSAELSHNREQLDADSVIVLQLNHCNTHLLGDLASGEIQIELTEFNDDTGLQWKGLVDIDAHIGNATTLLSMALEYQEDSKEEKLSITPTGSTSDALVIGGFEERLEAFSFTKTVDFSSENFELAANFSTISQVFGGELECATATSLAGSISKSSYQDYDVSEGTIECHNSDGDRLDVRASRSGLNAEHPGQYWESFLPWRDSIEGPLFWPDLKSLFLNLKMFPSSPTQDPLLAESLAVLGQARNIVLWHELSESRSLAVTETTDNKRAEVVLFDEDSHRATTRLTLSFHPLGAAATDELLFIYSGGIFFSYRIDLETDAVEAIDEYLMPANLGSSFSLDDWIHIPEADSLFIVGQAKKYRLRYSQNGEFSEAEEILTNHPSSFMHLRKSPEGDRLYAGGYQSSAHNEFTVSATGELLDHRSYALPLDQWLATNDQYNVLHGGSVLALVQPHPGPLLRTFVKTVNDEFVLADQRTLEFSSDLVTKTWDSGAAIALDNTPATTGADIDGVYQRLEIDAKGKISAGDVNTCHLLGYMPSDGTLPSISQRHHAFVSHRAPALFSFDPEAEQCKPLPLLGQTRFLENMRAVVADGTGENIYHLTTRPMGYLVVSRRNEGQISFRQKVMLPAEAVRDQSTKIAMSLAPDGDLLFIAFDDRLLSFQVLADGSVSKSYQTFQLQYPWENLGTLIVGANGDLYSHQGGYDDMSSKTALVRYRPDPTNGSLERLTVLATPDMPRVSAQRQELDDLFKVTPDGKYLYALSPHTGWLNVVELESFTVTHRAYNTLFNRASGLAFTSDGRHAFVTQKPQASDPEDYSDPQQQPVALIGMTRNPDTGALEPSAFLHSSHAPDAEGKTMRAAAYGSPVVAGDLLFVVRNPDFELNTGSLAQGVDVYRIEGSEFVSLRARLDDGFFGDGLSELLLSKEENTLIGLNRVRQEIGSLQLPQ